MSFSSIASMLSAAQESGQPLYAVIRDADCQENGYDAAASYRQIAALWTAMQQSSRQYCASDRSNSGLIGGDAARFRAAAEAGRLLGGTYFQRVTEAALKVAECNACMKRIVAAPTAGRKCRRVPLTRLERWPPAKAGSATPLGRAYNMPRCVTSNPCATPLRARCASTSRCPRARFQWILPLRKLCCPGKGKQAPRVH